MEITLIQNLQSLSLSLSISVHFCVYDQFTAYYVFWYPITTCLYHTTCLRLALISSITPLYRLFLDLFYLLLPAGCRNKICLSIPISLIFCQIIYVNYGLYSNSSTTEFMISRTLSSVICSIFYPLPLFTKSLFFCNL